MVPLLIYDRYGGMVVGMLAAALICAVVAASAISAVIAQREVISRLRRRHWEQEKEIARLHEAVDQWVKDYHFVEKANDRMVEKYIELANKEPLVIQPPDVAAIVREVGESIGTAIYGRQQEVQQDLQRQMQETSLVHEQPPPGQWFPDTEFDPGMGPMPTAGGWVNGKSNQHLPPPEGQTPTHVVVDGQLVRLDGQSLFQAGVSAPPPQGGVE